MSTDETRPDPPPFAGIDWSTADDLETFLDGLEPLAPGARERVVEQAILLLRGFYAHLPTKRALHGIDPIRRLEELRRRLALIRPGRAGDREFHAEMCALFAALRDRHTYYQLPADLAARTAFLPFLVRACGAPGGRRYLVADVAAGFAQPGLVPGAEIRAWSGVPVARAVRLLAGRSFGANPPAEHARAVQMLTLRPMAANPPPDEAWVIVDYRDPGGEARRTPPIPWKCFEVHREVAPGVDAHGIGLDRPGDMLRRAAASVYEPHLLRGQSAPEPARAAERGILATVLPTVFAARRIAPSGRTLGYLRIRTFHVDDVDAAAAEFARLLQHQDMPQDGLILDVRGNAGGQVGFAERLPQTLTPGPIEPLLFQFAATEEVARLCRDARRLAAPGDPPGYERWLDSVEHALESGLPYSAALPLTPPEACNAVGQLYHGPALLLADALSYSACDIFVASFEDHGIGEVLLSGGNTGAGGGSVFDLDGIRTHLNRDGAPLRELPHGMGLHVALRRTLRVRAGAGLEIEERGVGARRERTHWPTEGDVLREDADLLGHAARMLAGKPCYALRAAAGEDGLVRVSSRGLDRVDLFDGDRPLGAADVADPAEGPAETRFRTRPGAECLDIKGYAAGRLVAARRLRFGPEGAPAVPGVGRSRP